jgi:hypothetical protein
MMPRADLPGVLRKAGFDAERLVDMLRAFQRILRREAFATEDAKAKHAAKVRAALVDCMAQPFERSPIAMRATAHAMGAAPDCMGALPCQWGGQQGEAPRPMTRDPRRRAAPPGRAARRRARGRLAHNPVSRPPTQEKARIAQLKIDNPDKLDEQRKRHYASQREVLKAQREAEAAEIAARAAERGEPPLRIKTDADADALIELNDGGRSAGVDRRAGGGGCVRNSRPGDAALAADPPQGAAAPRLPNLCLLPPRAFACTCLLLHALVAFACTLVCFCNALVCFCMHLFAFACTCCACARVGQMGSERERPGADEGGDAGGKQHEEPLTPNLLNPPLTPPRKQLKFKGKQLGGAAAAAKLPIRRARSWAFEHRVEAALVEAALQRWIE